MYVIEKKKFGLFISQLRKEKGLTQKELAEKLYISDKAVSKWETGASIPDTALLIPLAQLLDVTVTELLLCQRQPDIQMMNPTDVENVVKIAVSYPQENHTRVWKTSGYWKLWYVLSLFIGLLILFISNNFDIQNDNATTSVLLGALFGAWFCFFAKEKLPKYYDENRINGIIDGPFRMNVPGIHFSNKNWPHIIAVGRIWSCVVMIGMPLISLVLSYFYPQLWIDYQLTIYLTVMLIGLIVPIYIIGHHYQ